MNLSYTAWRDWRDCPKRYYLKYRKQAPPTIKQNDYSKIYGMLVQAFFTNYANIWRFNTPYMPNEFIREKMVALKNTIMPTLTVDWSAFFVKYTEDQILEQAITDVCTIMSSPDSNNLFLNTKSEVEIKIETKDGVNITGRLDFIHTYPLDNRILIFDGKGTDKIKKTVDEDQLLYYALLYQLHYGKIPDELAFFYYRFNQLSRIALTKNLLDEFRARLSLDVKKLLTESEFKATPTPKGCRKCEYREGCPEKEKRERAHKRKSMVDDLPEPSGIMEFGM